jgi:hypothetical protein
MTSTAAGTTMTSTAAGTTMTSTVAGTTMTATAIAGHNKHGLYLYLPVCATIAPKKGRRRQVLLLYTGRKASASLPQTDPEH